MKLKRLIKVQLRYFALASALLLPLNALSETIIFDKGNFTHINFKKIPPSQFKTEDNLISIEVNNSSSFLLIPFKNVKQVKTVSFEWKQDGMLNVDNAEHEETRNGDDATLRVGLMLAGENLLMNPLAPKWVKQVRETLIHSSNRVIYLTPNTKHQAGEHWKSPYSDEIDIIAVSSEKITQDWQLSKHIFNNELSVVGLWIMADGDNTQSAFTTKLRELTLN